jgi:hypothetical protein
MLLTLGQQLDAMALERGDDLRPHVAAEMPGSLPVRAIVGSPLEKLGVLAKTVLPSRTFEYVFRKAYGP